MADIINLDERRRKRDDQPNNPFLQKVVNGEIVECVNLDRLTPAQLAQYFSDAASGK